MRDLPSRWTPTIDRTATWRSLTRGSSRTRCNALTSSSKRLSVVGNTTRMFVSSEDCFAAMHMFVNPACIHAFRALSQAHNTLQVASDTQYTTQNHIIIIIIIIIIIMQRLTRHVSVIRLTNRSLLDFLVSNI